MTKWDAIEKSVARAIGGIVWAVYGAVSFSLKYENGIVLLDIFDAPKNTPDKKIQDSFEYEYEINNSTFEYKIIADIVSHFEKEIYNN